MREHRKNLRARSELQDRTSPNLMHHRHAGPGSSLAPNSTPSPGASSAEPPRREKDQGSRIPPLSSFMLEHTGEVAALGAAIAVGGVSILALANGG